MQQMLYCKTINEESIIHGIKFTVKILLLILTHIGANVVRAQARCAWEGGRSGH